MQHEPTLHDWFYHEGFKLTCCSQCGITLNTTNKDRPCHGRVKVTLRGE